MGGLPYSTLVAVYLTTLLACSTVPVSSARAAGLSSAENATARGIAMRYYPERSYVNIRQFSLAGTATEDKIASLVTSASWCDEHFNFELLESIEERMASADGNVNAECHLLTRSDDVPAVMQDLLSGLLDRPVGAGIEDGELRASFNWAEGEVELDQNNAEGLFIRKNGRAMLIWKSPLEYYEAVWIAADWSEAPTPLPVSKPLASPALDESDLNRLRETVRKESTSQ